jgi:hypothetical protein
MQNSVAKYHLTSTRYDYLISRSEAQKFGF